MRYFFLLFTTGIFASCHFKSIEQSQGLKDTLERLRKECDYQPLSVNQVYDFLNKCYLPRLDTLKIGRRIFVSPLYGRDFNKIFKADSTLITEKYMGDTASIRKQRVIIVAPNYTYNKYYKWDATRLHKTTVIADSLIIVLNDKPHHISFEERQKWFEKVKPGYMIISYPQYNANSKQLFIREWFENTDWCETGREQEFSFKKTPGAWERN